MTYHRYLIVIPRSTRPPPPNLPLPKPVQKPETLTPATAVTPALPSQKPEPQPQKIDAASVTKPIPPAKPAIMAAKPILPSKPGNVTSTEASTKSTASTSTATNIASKSSPEVKSQSSTAAPSAAKKLLTSLRSFADSNPAEKVTTISAPVSQSDKPVVISAPILKLDSPAAAPVSTPKKMEISAPIPIVEQVSQADAPPVPKPKPPLSPKPAPRGSITPPTPKSPTVNRSTSITAHGDIPLPVPKVKPKIAPRGSVELLKQSTQDCTVTASAQQSSLSSTDKSNIDRPVPSPKPQPRHQPQSDPAVETEHVIKASLPANIKDRPPPPPPKPVIAKSSAVQHTEQSVHKQHVSLEGRLPLPKLASRGKGDLLTKPTQPLETETKPETKYASELLADAKPSPAATDQHSIKHQQHTSTKAVRDSSPATLGIKIAKETLVDANTHAPQPAPRPASRVIRETSPARDMQQHESSTSNPKPTISVPRPASHADRDMSPLGKPRLHVRMNDTEISNPVEQPEIKSPPSDLTPNTIRRTLGQKPAVPPPPPPAAPLPPATPPPPVIPPLPKQSSIDQIEMRSSSFGANAHLAVANAESRKSFNDQLSQSLANKSQFLAEAAVLSQLPEPPSRPPPALPTSDSKTNLLESPSESSPRAASISITQPTTSTRASISLTHAAPAVPQMTNPAPAPAKAKEPKESTLTKALKLIKGGKDERISTNTTEENGSHVSASLSSLSEAPATAQACFTRLMDIASEMRKSIKLKTHGTLFGQPIKNSFSGNKAVNFLCKLLDIDLM